MFLKKNDMIRLLNNARVVGLTDFKSDAYTNSATRARFGIAESRLRNEVGRVARVFPMKLPWPRSSEAVRLRA